MAGEATIGKLVEYFFVLFRLYTVMAYVPPVMIYIFDG